MTTPPAWNVLGDIITCKVSGKETGGAFALFEVDSPAGNGPPPHIHRREDETFYILEGTGRCIVDGVEHALVPGATVMLGRYCEHSIHNDGPGELKFVWFFTPPGLEQVIEATGRPRKAGEPPPTDLQRPPNMDEVLKQAGYATAEEMKAAVRK